jgi:hypothetical protein
MSSNSSMSVSSRDSTPPFYANFFGTHFNLETDETYKADTGRVTGCPEVMQLYDKSGTRTLATNIPSTS